LTFLTQQLFHPKAGSWSTHYLLLKASGLLLMSSDLHQYGKPIRSTLIKGDEQQWRDAWRSFPC
jgi:hypothetical protein